VSVRFFATRLLVSLCELFASADIVLAPPVPDNVMLCGKPAALFGNSVVMDALRLPVAVGVKVTEKLQLPPAGTLLPQVLVCVKSPGLVPVMAMVLIARAAVPVLLSVTD
jgi:hypothetical protein